MTLLSVEEEKQACFKAFDGFGPGTLTRHWFKGSACLFIDTPYEYKSHADIIITHHDMSKTDKSRSLRLFRPIIYSDAWDVNLKRVYALLQKAYAAAKTPTSNMDPQALADMLRIRDNFSKLYFSQQHAVDCPECPYTIAKGK